jgi:molybdate transport system permease protein
MTGAEWQVLGFTAGVSATATLAILPPGLALAWLLARRQWPGKTLVETLVSLPLVMPPVATGLILLHILGRRGPVGSWFHDVLGMDIVFTWRAVVAALAVMAFPLLVRTARAAFEQVNPRLEQVARTLGAGELRVFLRITLPLALRGVSAGTLLAFARCLGEFGATIVVAGNIPGVTTTLSLSIFQAIQMGEDSHALRLLGISVTVAFAALGASEWLLRQRPSPHA